jgi:phage terminase large subunit
MVTAGKIKAEYEATHYDMRPSEILIDAIGLGAGVYDRCREMGLPVRAINVGEAAATRENCMRLLVQGARMVSGESMLDAAR